MKKKFLLLIVLFAFFRAYSQVGVNTSTPSAALDVLSKGTTSATKALEINDSTDKELLRVQDDGGVRFEKYKNIGVLGTDANGFLVDGSNLNIPSLGFIGSATSSPVIVGGSGYDVLYNSQKPTSNLTYNNGLFTINKAGFYQVTVFTLFDISMNTPTGGSGYTQIVLNNGGSQPLTIGYNLTSQSDGVTSFGHTVSGFRYLNVGDVVYVHTAYARSFKVYGGSIGFVYYGT